MDIIQGGISVANNIYEAVPCPFCGNTKVKVDCKKSSNFRYRDGKREDNYNVTTRCNKCHARGPANTIWLDSYDSRNAIRLLTEQALNSWNTRFIG